jgi:uncharacterized protein
MSVSSILKVVEHRPWQLPGGPWVMTQAWDDLLFAHWPVPVDALRQIVPSALALDTYEGQAWLGVVPFGISDFRPRWFPPVPGLSYFPELNVRTYVTVEDKPGIFFFSLDVNNPLAVVGARAWFHLPYFLARMALRSEGDGVHYTSHRTHPNAQPADFAASYHPTGNLRTPQLGLEHWLTERYCLYAVDSRRHVYRGEIHHVPWPLQSAEARIVVNTMAPRAIHLPDTAPLLHFSRRQQVLIWPPYRVRL